MIAHSLLIKCGWNPTIATQEFLKHTAETLFNYKPAMLTEAAAAAYAGEEFECQCCFEDYDPNGPEVISIEDCGHSLCVTCYRMYLE